KFGSDDKLLTSVDNLQKSEAAAFYDEGYWKVGTKLQEVSW
ncbi:hypothetical protein NPIL_656131, partial [Nephila pilipes]